MNHKPPKPKSNRTNLASCVVATVFLIFVAIVVLIVFFTLFRPKSPEISVNAVQLPAFSISNSTANFTFSQYNTVRNPNRAEFNHYDSTLELLYYGDRVGFVFIPAGTIDAGRTKYMSATFSVQSFPFTAVAESVDGVIGGMGGVGRRLEIESKMKMEGRVRVLAIFTHHVETRVDCRVEIDLSNGSVVGFRC